MLHQFSEVFFSIEKILLKRPQKTTSNKFPLIQSHKVAAKNTVAKQIPLGWPKGTISRWHILLSLAEYDRGPFLYYVRT